MAKHDERKTRRAEENKAKRGKEFTAHHRFARMAARKVRLVADQVRGLSINKALETLKFSKKRGAAMLNKVVKSALANAEYQISEQKLDIDVDNLFLADVQVDEGPSVKRWMTRARGMAYPILHRLCHIHATLKPKAAADEAGDEGKAAKRKAVPKEKAAGAAKAADNKAMAGAK